MLVSASSWAYGPAPSKNCGCGCHGQPELHLTAAVAAHNSGGEQMTRCLPNRSTGALDCGRSTPKSQSPGPLRDSTASTPADQCRPLSARARQHLHLAESRQETSPSVSDAASNCQRLSPTAWEMRTSGPLASASQLSTGTPIPRADPVRDTSPTRRKELSMAMSINDVDTRINS
jgi:hypothetical protein